jgi:hypothetical protein
MVIAITMLLSPKQMEFDGPMACVMSTIRYVVRVIGLEPILLLGTDS